MSEQQVDDKVRQYIADKYMPVLIMNYQHIYTQLHDNSGVFSNCDKVTAIKPGEDVLKALCLKEDNNQIKLSYMTNGYSQGWNTSMTLVFNTIEEEYVLTSIELHLKNGVKAYVEGI
ncbi:hypothetical protein [uncultured Paraglaciecola sp.]|uniref:hypothetical protein n=1 Tax=uncultured Paraglaciecola sp. TaxID=1765024 RepID=UPI0025984CF8|nr:hypothetical protein [uncultured Paraglaciecola sp.]